MWLAMPHSHNKDGGGAEAELRARLCAVGSVGVHTGSLHHELQTTGEHTWDTFSLMLTLMLMTRRHDRKQEVKVLQESSVKQTKLVSEVQEDGRVRTDRSDGYQQLSSSWWISKVIDNRRVLFFIQFVWSDIHSISVCVCVCVTVGWWVYKHGSLVLFWSRFTFNWTTREVDVYVRLDDKTNLVCFTYNGCKWKHTWTEWL